MEQIDYKNQNFTYYWTTNNEQDFSNLRMISGNIMTTSKGLIFGAVKDHNNIFSDRFHIICGMRVGIHYILIDIRSFDFQNPIMLDFKLSSDYGETIAKTNMISYGKVPMTPSKITLKEHDENILHRFFEKSYQSWLEKTDRYSKYYFDTLVQVFLECLLLCNQDNVDAEMVLQEYLKKINLNYEEKKEYYETGHYRTREISKK